MPEGKVNYNYTGLPSPVDFQNKNVATAISWGYETSLDVEWSHAMAPGASHRAGCHPNAETQGVQGIPRTWRTRSSGRSTTTSARSGRTASRHHGAGVPQQRGLDPGLDKFYASAAAQGVTAFFAHRRLGCREPRTSRGTSSRSRRSATRRPVPNIVSVGGTQVTTPTASISSYQPESVWNDGFGAGGGGYSTVFAEPSYQSAAGIPDPTGTRGLPDVSMNAAVTEWSALLRELRPDGRAGLGDHRRHERGNTALGRHRRGDEPGRRLARLPRAAAVPDLREPRPGTPRRSMTSRPATTPSAGSPATQRRHRLGCRDRARNPERGRAGRRPDPHHSVAHDLLEKWGGPPHGGPPTILGLSSRLS